VVLGQGLRACLTGDIQALGTAPPVNLTAAAAIVETTLESAAWLNVPLTFVGVAGCTTAICPVTGFNTGSGSSNGADFTLSGLVADVWGIWYDNQFLALSYSAAIAALSISGLPNKVTNIFAYCTADCFRQETPVVPLPGALVLMGTVLAGGTGFGAWRRRRARAALSAL
jgi:hypothetical protein